MLLCAIFGNIEPALPAAINLDTVCILSSSRSASKERDLGMTWQRRVPNCSIKGPMADKTPKRRMTDSEDDAGTGIVTKTRPKTKRPSLYKVLLLNDDYTPMEFVVLILERFFNKNREEAVEIMLHVHRSGVGICGVFTYEVAETKVAQVIEFARRHQHPLQCTMEKE